MKIGIFCGPHINQRLQRYLRELGYPEAVEESLHCDLLFISESFSQVPSLKNQLLVWVYSSPQLPPSSGPETAEIFFYLDLSAPDFICRQNLQMLLRNGSVLQEHQQLAPIAQQLQTMVAQSLVQLQKLKKFSEKIVPLRHEFHGPISIFFKYGAGEKIGGDFYDLVTKKHFLYLFLFNTRSYLVSSSIMARVSQWAARPDDSDLTAFLAQMMPEIASYRSGPDDPISQVACVALAINLKTLAFQGHVFGQLRFILVNQNNSLTGNEFPFTEAFLSPSHVQGVFASNSSLTICSPGVLANMGGNMPGPVEIAQKYQLASERDYCNEFFIAMSRYKVNDFYQNDASVVLLKVDKHALFEI